MSALAMILTAAMMVPGDGPEKPSMEMVQELDLSGEWEGIRQRGNGEIDRFFIDLGEAWTVPLVIRWVFRSHPRDFKVVDEGKGKLRWKWEPFDSTCLGIYKRDNDRLILCLGEANGKRPTSFQAVNGQILLILHRVKSRK